jgi:hypothetical protein
MVRLRLLLLVALTGGLWGLDQLATTYGLFPNADFARILKIAAVTSAAVLAVAAIGWLISEIGIGLMLRTRPAGVHRIRLSEVRSMPPRACRLVDPAAWRSYTASSRSEGSPACSSTLGST